jgi:hypothetical protein
MRAECLEVSSALLRWSHWQPKSIAVQAEVLAAVLERLAERPHSIPLRRMVATQVAALDALVHGKEQLNGDYRRTAAVLKRNL